MTSEGDGCRRDRGARTVLLLATVVLVLTVVRDTVFALIGRPILPLVLLATTLLFLLAQNHLDGRDPRPTGASIDADPELDFLHFSRRRGGAC